MTRTNTIGETLSKHDEHEDCPPVGSAQHTPGPSKGWLMLSNAAIRAIWALDKNERASNAERNHAADALREALQELDFERDQSACAEGMTIAGDGASMLGKLMREQYASRGGVYPDGNPNAAIARTTGENQ